MIVPQLANIKKKDYFDIYIGRENKWLNLEQSKWHNPFVMKNESQREDVVNKYREYILDNPKLLESLHELDGQILGCYCYSSHTKTGKKCHGSVLIELFQDIYKDEL